MKATIKSVIFLIIVTAASAYEPQKTDSRSKIIIGYKEPVSSWDYRVVSNDEKTELWQFFSPGNTDLLCVGCLPEKSGFMNHNYEIVIPSVYVVTNNFNEGLAAVLPIKNKYWMYINTKGEIIIDLKITLPGPFVNGIAKVCLEGNNWYLIDKTGKLLKTTTPTQEYLESKEFETKFKKEIKESKGKSGW